MLNPVTKINQVHNSLKEYISQSSTYQEGKIRWQLAEREIARWNEFDIPLRKRVYWWSRGFLTRSSVIYPVDDWGHSQFINDVERERSNKINFQHGIATRNKLLLARQLHSIPEATHPEVYGILNEEGLIPNSCEGAESATTTDLVEKHGTVVLKPIYGFRGKGILMVSQGPDNHYLVNGEVHSKDELDELESGLSLYIITEFVEQAQYLESIYPEATNTIRVVTMQLPEDTSSSIVAAVQRIGTEETAPTDNWSNGGLAAEVDQRTGELQPAIGLSDGGRESYQTHPDTGEQIAGQSIPCWDEIYNEITKTSDSFPELPYIAWDVLPDVHSNIVIIEANSFPDVDITQLRQPLLSNSAVEKFFRSHDIITRRSC